MGSKRYGAEEHFEDARNSLWLLQDALKKIEEILVFDTAAKVELTVDVDEDGHNYICLTQGCEGVDRDLIIVNDRKEAAKLIKSLQSRFCDLPEGEPE